MGLFDRLFGGKKEKKEAAIQEAELQQEQDKLDSDKQVQESAITPTVSSSAGQPEVETSSQAPAVDVDASEPAAADRVQADQSSSSSVNTAGTEASAPQSSTIKELEAELEVPVVDEAWMEETLDESNFMASYNAMKASIDQEIKERTPELEESAPADEEASAPEEVQEQAADSQADQDGESQEEKYDRTLKKTRTGFGARLNAFFANFRRVDEDFFEELEELLILSDVGVQVATQLTEQLRQEVKLENAKKPDDVRRVVVEKLVDIYEKDGQYHEQLNFQEDLTVMLFVGVNGVGKTTSIGKLAYKYKQEGKKVMLVAADTFRAGAVAQLVEWGKRVDVPVVAGPEKSDPASVVFDGVEQAVKERVDILMIDTAGRLQNKDNLMAELEKIGRIIKRVIPDAPHETLLALDASTGQNALNQAKEFSKITPVTGIILTKLDGTAKGGVVLAIREELDIPVKLIGFGEKIDDIGEFHSEDFMRSLLAGLLD